MIEARNMIEEMVDAAEHPTNEYLPTGLAAINNIFGGGLPQGLHVFAGAPGAGKTSFAVQIAHNVAKNGGDSVIYELEMAASYVVSRGIAREAYLDDPSDRHCPYCSRLDHPNKNNPMPERTIERMRIGARKYMEYANHVFVETELSSITDICDSVNDFIEKHNTKPLVIIDHLRCIGVKGVSDIYEAEREAVNALKSMADHHGIAVILIATLNKGGMKGASGMGDVRGSTDIPFAADTLTLLTPDESNMELVHFKTVKNRYGSCGTADLEFIGEVGVFSGMEDDEEYCSAVEADDILDRLFEGVK